jgi:hypothetical protein
MINRNLVHIFISQALSVILIYGPISSGIIVHSNHSPAQAQETLQSRLATVVLESATAPPEIGGAYSKIISSSITDSGEIAFSATLSGSQASGGVFLKTGDEVRVILRSGDQAPGGARFKSFSELDLSHDNHLIFRAELEGGSSSEGIFLWTPDDIEAVALAGAKSPRRGLTYKSFAQPTILFVKGPPDFPSEELSIALVATFKNGKKAILIQDLGGSLREILVTGDTLFGPDEKVDDFTIGFWGALAFSCVVEAHKIGSESRYKRLILVGSFIGGGTKLIEGKRFKGVGTIKRIVLPPAVFFQQSYVAVDFKGGLTGLASDDGGLAEVFVKTGDPAPGLAGETIESLSPPVSNSSMTSPPSGLGQRGVVSAVRLSGGREALWFGRFTHSIPALAGKVRLMLVGGSTGPGQGPILREFLPVRLTNTGKLLLRGVVGEANATRAGLFLLDGLFEQ